MRRRQDNGAIISRINVTPIIDVALVLVIILLVTAPMMSAADLPVNLPAARTRAAEDERNMSVTLSADGALAVDEEHVAANGLVAAIAQHLQRAGNPDLLVVVRADTACPYADVHRVLDAARAAGARRLAIATRQRTENAL
jgi:biopolymer transport protein ExbD